MKKSIELIPTTEMSREDWLRYRKSGVGASETGVIMGLSPYKASIQLFYEKIGQGIIDDMESLAAFLGTTQESYIASLWEFWNGTQAGMMSNYRARARVRRCRRVNAYARNSRYPWLFVSLDREINQHVDSDGVMRGNGALEIKTIGGYEADKWEGGIPPVYVVQLQTQLLVCEYDYGEMALLQDNRRFDVLPFEKNKTIQDHIVRTSKDFWERVEKGRICANRIFEGGQTYNARLVDEATAELHSYEPPPDNSEAYNNFLKEKYQIAAPGEKTGTLTLAQHAKQHADLRSRIKELDQQMQLHENSLKAEMREAEKITFGDDGFVSWKGTPRRFLNKYKG